METYIGTKIVKAEPMDECTFLKTEKGEDIENSRPTRSGYKVKYDNDYVSWSPKEVFEAAYRKISDNEKAFII